MLLLWEMRWWVMRERNRLCVFSVSPCYGMHATLCDESERWNWSIHICLRQWICRQVYFNLCVVHVMLGKVSCDLPRMLQPQVKEERVWTSATLVFHQHHGQLVLVLRMESEVISSSVLRPLAVLMASLRKIIILWFLDCWVRSH